MMTFYYVVPQFLTQCLHQTPIGTEDTLKWGWAQEGFFTKVLFTEVDGVYMNHSLMQEPGGLALELKEMRGAILLHS